MAHAAWPPIEPPGPPSLALLEPRSGPASPSRLERLSRELLDLVLGFIRRESPATLCSLALVSSQFYRLARYHQLHELTLGAHLGSWATYLANSGFAGAVRRLTIGPRCLPTDDIPLSSMLAPMVASLTALVELTWLDSMPIPDAILSDLEQRPGIHLHVRFKDPTWPPQRPSVLDKLAGCTSLVSLDVEVEYTTVAANSSVMRPFKGVLLSCPSLRRLKLNHHIPEDRGFMYNFRDYLGLSFRDGERPVAALEDLDMEDYPFGHQLLDRSMPNGWDQADTEYQYWLEHFDWSRLRRLRITSKLPHVFALLLARRLTSLRELDLVTGLGREQRVEDTVSLVPSSLESIHAGSMVAVGLNNLQKHGASLRHLSLHRTQDASRPRLPGETWAKEAMDTGRLTSLRARCPGLEYLGIDLVRRDSWPYDSFAVLASFPRLRRLEIWFELGWPAGEEILPCVVFHGVRQICSYLLRQSASRLEQVILHSGAPRPGPWSHYPCWPVENSTTFVCMPSPRDDAAARNLFTITCTSLSKPDNEFLQSTQPGWSSSKLGQKISQFLEAHRAPNGSEQTRAMNDAHRRGRLILAYSGPQPESDDDDHDL